MPERPRRASPAERRRRLRRRRAGSALACLILLAAVLAVSLSAAGGGGPRRASAASRARRPPRRSHGTQAAPAGPSAGYPETSEIRRLIAAGRPIYCAPQRGDEVALSFDDGPGPYTKLMLAKLRKHRLQATFFSVARNIALAPELLRQERLAGAVGDHTYTHRLLTALSPAGQEAEIARAQRAIARASRGPVFLFRPPYGAHDALTDRTVRAHGLLEILWDVDSRDSLGASYAQIERTVIAGLRPGAIVLMHENHGQTVRAMLAIFAALKRRHLRAVSVPQLLTDDPPGPQLRAADGGCGPGAAKSRSGG